MHGDVAKHHRCASIVCLKHCKSVIMAASAGKSLYSRAVRRKQELKSSYAGLLRIPCIYMCGARNLTDSLDELVFDWQRMKKKTYG